MKNRHVILNPLDLIQCNFLDASDWESHKLVSKPVESWKHNSQSHYSVICISGGLLCKRTSKDPVNQISHCHSYDIRNREALLKPMVAQVYCWVRNAGVIVYVKHRNCELKKEQCKCRCARPAYRHTRPSTPNATNLPLFVARWPIAWIICMST